MTFHLEPKPAKRRQGAAYIVGQLVALVIALSVAAVIVAAAIAAVRGLLGA